MYKVYADDVLIHDSYSPDNTIHLVSPNLTMTDSAAGSFDMTMLSDNPGYDIIQRMVTTIIIKKDNHTIWTGRVVNEAEDFWKRRKFTCEGALSFLNDSIQELAYYDNYTLSRFFSRIIDVHNAKVPYNRQFRVGTITVDDPFDDFKYKTEYKNTIDTLSDNFFSRLNGHIRVRYSDADNVPIIDYLADYLNTSSQEINFGSNLLDFTKNWDLANLATVILPRGVQLEEENSHGDRDYLTIEDVNNHSKYLINEEAVNAFGRIEQIVDFNDVDDKTVLKRLGEIYLENTQFDNMVLNVSAVDLHMLNPDIVSFELLDRVRCYSAPHGLNKVFPITQIEIPLDSPDGVKYTMGLSEEQSLTNKTLKSNRKMQNDIVNTTDSLLSDAKKQAAEIINQKTTGYVNIITEDDISQALIISDTPDIENATNLWRFNIRGLGYSNDGGETYGTAITMDGSIVASYIKTGRITDGIGRNYWDLDTGEFSMSYNTSLVDPSGHKILVNDLVSTAQTGVNIAREAYNKEYGANNILHGSGVLKQGYGSLAYWGEGIWSFNHNGSSAIMKIEDITDAPNGKMKACFDVTNASDNNVGEIIQKEVPVYPNTVYTMSCYAKGTGVIQLKAGKIIRNSAVYIYRNGSVNDSNSWRRYYYSFKTGENGSIYGENVAGIFDNKVDVHFAVLSGTMKLCGFKLERGNSASDWTESAWDIDQTANEYTEKYVEVVAEAGRDYTQDQLDALDISFTQEKILKRLTNNFANTGLYQTNGQLYINANYIRSGTIDAGIVKAGILTDAKQNNKWNLTTGYLKTNALEANGIRANGEFISYGDKEKKTRTVFSYGSIHSYTSSATNAKPHTWLDFYKNNGDSDLHGLELGSHGGISIQAPRILVTTNSYKSGRTVAWTGKINYKTIGSVSFSGSSLRYTTNEHGIECINGLVISAW